MSNPNLSNHLSSIYKDLKAYIDARYRYIKLDASEKLIRIVSSLTLIVVLILIFSLALLFFFIAMAFYIGNILHDNFLGFLIVAGIFVFLLLLLILLRKPLIVHPIQKSMLKSIFKPENNSK